MAFSGQEYSANASDQETFYNPVAPASARHDNPGFPLTVGRSLSKWVKILMVVVALLAILLMVAIGLLVTIIVKHHSNHITTNKPMAATTAASKSTTPQPTSLPTPESTRLPSSLFPIIYWLTVQPYFPSSVHYSPTKNFSFDATVLIQFNCSQFTNNITLHALDLTIQRRIRLVNLTSGANIEIYGTLNFYKKQQKTIMLKEILKPGCAYMLNISYSGRINPYSMNGLFWTTYRQQDGRPR